MILALVLYSPTIQVSCSTVCFCTSTLFLVLYVLLSDTKSYTLPLENASQEVIRQFQVIRFSLRSGSVDEGKLFPAELQFHSCMILVRHFDKDSEGNTLLRCRIRGNCWTSQGTLRFDVTDAEIVSGHANRNLYRKW
jgi:hypothetical protein